MLNRMYKFLTQAMGMKSTCCHTDKYLVIENCPVCTNDSCSNYLGRTDLKNLFVISFQEPVLKTS